MEGQVETGNVAGEEAVDNLSSIQTGERVSYCYGKERKKKGEVVGCFFLEMRVG